MWLYPHRDANPSRPVNPLLGWKDETEVNDETNNPTRQDAITAALGFVFPDWTLETCERFASGLADLRPEDQERLFAAFHRSPDGRPRLPAPQAPGAILAKP